MHEVLGLVPCVSVMPICSDDVVGLVAGQVRAVIGGGNYGCSCGQCDIPPVQPMWVLTGSVVIPKRLALIAN